MKRKIITTSDGSKTIHLEEWNEQYHSKHGAINEAKYVFIKSGLQYYIDTFFKFGAELSILEIGFGTGLNAFLTCLQAEIKNISIDYVGVEAYPVNQDELVVLNYAELIANESSDIFQKLHTSDWETPQKITNHFQLTKQQQFFNDIEAINKYNMVYFDAFGARVQPELWTEAIFQNMYNALKANGVLVTYSAKGSVRRAMQAVGFKVERLPGPPGKREMLRAIKPRLCSRASITL